MRPGSTCQDPAERACCRRGQNRPHWGGGHWRQLGAEEVGVELVTPLVATEVPLQAVDKLQVTGTEMRLTEVPEFCKRHTKSQ